MYEMNLNLLASRKIGESNFALDPGSTSCVLVCAWSCFTCILNKTLLYTYVPKFFPYNCSWHRLMGALEEGDCITVYQLSGKKGGGLEAVAGIRRREYKYI